MTGVKICGLTEEDGLVAAVNAGADWIGLVFFERSPRAITPDEAALLLDGLPPSWEGGPERVGLFVDPDDALLDAAVGSVRLDMIQLHGSETPDRVDEIRDRFALPVMKALPIATREDLAAADAYADVADWLLLDARAPADAGRPGGNAVAFDWSILDGWEAPLPWMLAGGLTVDNVREALLRTRAYAVDVSSGVERERGIKDPELIEQFVRAVREVLP
ncbi:phosphoribosylanthranilate isomerase [Phaeovibrio sulfidiphilus]|uniref:N-(5'-phosphoribosyl)anthranilate isomerase n=1 Tax=Phaeovibrio sulfidiphilus TaxID=1220600 RepID=A0A8J7CCD7_9PROT|nr:phosphoribosylanthranilate isomerase [Phaeovibrio sulfidiphilus]MBE1237173.1 phosphoribosylanthranilate isomerase [Phaeovibrio sulfidiphilus]